jgi:penicillin-binding protein 1B
VALVGGRGGGSFDRALYGRRPIGSTVKALTMLAAFEQDLSLSPATVLVDEPIERTVDGKAWAPTNYDGTFAGPVTLREAVSHSRNVPAILLAEQVGMARLASFWRQLGLQGAGAWPSAALGAFDASPLELASAYAVFPAGGVRRRPILARAAAGPDGHAAWTAEGTTSRPTSDRAAFLALSVLEDVLATGTGSGAARFGVTTGAAGKTGTTDDERDAWFAGFTPELAVAVWVGFDQGRALGLTGAEAALPAWSRFVAATGTAGPFPPPATVERVSLCRESHDPAAHACPETYEDWASVGRPPSEACTVHRSDPLGLRSFGLSQRQDPSEEPGKKRRFSFWRPRE